MKVRHNVIHCTSECVLDTIYIIRTRAWSALQLSSVQSLSHVQLFSTPWTAARQASLSITNSRSLPRLMSIESVMPANHLILCRPLLLPPSIFPSIRIFSNESALCIRWPKYWSSSFNISPSNEHPGLISFGWTGWISFPRDSQESSPTPQFRNNKTGSRSGKEYVKAVNCHPAYLTSMQSTSCEMPGWMKYKLELRLPGEISTASGMQMIPF